MVMFEYTSDPPPTPFARRMLTPSPRPRNNPKRPEGPSVVISNRPSLLLPRRRHRVTMSINPLK